MFRKLPRFFIQCRAQFRFEVISSYTTSDGLHYAHVKRIDDTNPVDEGDSYDAIQYVENILTTRRVVKSMIDNLGDEAREYILREHGKMPDDPALLSFWCGDLFGLDM